MSGATAKCVVHIFWDDSGRGSALIGVLGALAIQGARRLRERVTLSVACVAPRSRSTHSESIATRPPDAAPECRACRAERHSSLKAIPEYRTKRAVSSSRWQRKNRARRNAMQNERRAADLEAARERERRYRRANPDVHRGREHRRRAQRAGVSVGRISPALLAQKWIFWAGRCWMCGGEAVEWDHVKPMARGGAHVLANLRPSCARCNRSKWAHWPLPTRK